MSIVDEIRSDLASHKGKLDQERAKLVAQRDGINTQIAEIDSLLKQIGTMEGKPSRAAPTARRSGIRDQVLAAVKAGHSKPADIRTALNLTGKSAGQSVSNALSALKSRGKIVADDSGAYCVTE